MDKSQRKFIQIIEQLDESSRKQLLDFAQFLLAKQGPAQPQTPLNIERPGEEKVIDAIKRLSKTYPMLPKKKMMGPASDLLSRHMMNGQEAHLVIDELEDLFKKQFLEYQNGVQSPED